MEIRNNTNLAFGTNVRTAKILEACTFKYIESEGISDLRPLIDEFWHTPLKAAGNRGYRYYIKNIADKIQAKYPEIKQASDEILEFVKQNPYAKKTEIKTFVDPIIKKLGEEIDITI